MHVNYRWIEIDTIGLSDENKKIIYDLINNNVDGFSIGGMSHNPRLFVHNTGLVLNRDYNPDLISATLQDALTFYNDWELYIKEEGRIYNSYDALESHLKYVEQIKNKNGIK